MLENHLILEFELGYREGSMNTWAKYISGLVCDLFSISWLLPLSYSMVSVSTYRSSISRGYIWKIKYRVTTLPFNSNSRRAESDAQNNKKLWKNGCRGLTVAGGIRISSSGSRLLMRSLHDSGLQVLKRKMAKSLATKIYRDNHRSIRTFFHAQ